MRIDIYPNEFSQQLSSAFVTEGLTYGRSSVPTSLISPASTVLSEAEFNGLEDDLNLLWTLYDRANSVYQMSVNGDMPSWICTIVENGMSDIIRDIHRGFSKTNMAPKLGRVDYVSLGEHRQIAEVQWKSGGPGLFFGVQETFNHLFPRSASQRKLFEPSDSIGDIILQLTAVNSSNLVALSVSSTDWLVGESYLQRKLLSRGIRYLPVAKEEFCRQVTLEGGSCRFFENNREFQVSFINGQSFTRAIKEEDLVALANICLAGKVWIESPLNYIYRQKWVLALPFMREFKDMFDLRLSRIIIPTVLIQQDLRIDFSGISHQLAEMGLSDLGEVTQLAGLLQLSEGTRRRIILKCGGGISELLSDGRGVMRLGGSRANAEKTLKFIANRIKSFNEPWIIQPYIDQLYEVPLSCPWSLEKVDITPCHARFLVFGARTGDRYEMVGGLGNFGTNWKVSGSVPKISNDGLLYGTAFTDIRVLSHDEVPIVHN